MASLTDRIRSSTLSVPKRLRVLIVTLLFLLVPLAIYFTFYISGQTTYITNRNFRQLAGISLQVEQRIENLKEAFGNAVENTIEKNYEFRQATKTIAKTAAVTSSSHPPPASPPPSLAQYLAALGAGFVAVEEPPLPEYANPEELKHEIKSRQIRMEVHTAGETSELLFVYEIKHSSTDKNIKPELLKFEATVSLDDIVNPLVGKRRVESIRGSEHEEGFDAILIASLEDKGKNKASQETSEPTVTSKIIFQQGSPELDIDSLDNLPRADTPDKTIDFKAISRSSSSTDVRLADTNYKAYLQPLEIPLPAVAPGDPAIANSQTGSQWLICGLVQASHFRRETWAFPYTWLIILAFVTALVTLSWPFLKLLFSGPKDRIRLADVYFVAFALLIGSAIFTFFLLFGFSYRMSESNLDSGLEKFSNDISDHFSREVTMALEEIDKINADQRLVPALAEIEKVSDKEHTESKSIPEKTDEDSEDPQLIFVRNKFERTNIFEPGMDETSPILSVKDPYPYFLKAAWIDELGRMRLLWTTTAQTSYLKSVSDRDYFTKLFQGNSRSTDMNEQYWLEPINSRFTAAKTVIISKPHRTALSPKLLREEVVGENPVKNDKIKSIVAIDPNIMSLMHAVVPAGFGYRVIDNSGLDPGDEGALDPGKVIFQSSESKQLRENLFEECDNNHSLRSLVFGRVNGFVNVNYKGEEHRFYITPIKGFANWSLVVFRNKQPLRTVFLETLTLAGSIFLVYAAIMLIVFVVIYLARTNSPDRTEWIWPFAGMSAIYHQSFLVNLVLFSASFLFVLVFEGKLAIISVCIFALLAIVHLTLRLKYKWSVKKLDWLVEFLKINKLFEKRDAYVWNVVLLLLLTGILPAIAFFKVAYNEEMRLFVKHGQLTIAQGLEDREVRIRHQYSTERVNPSNNPAPIKNPIEARWLIERRLGEKLDIYDEFFFGTARSPVDKEYGKEAPDSLLVLFNSQVPFFNETSIEMGGLIEQEAADESWSWEDSAGEKLTLHIPRQDGDLHITTPLQRFGLPLRWLPLWAVGFFVVLIILFYLTRKVVRKVFLLDIDESLDLSNLPDDESSIKENLFVIQSWPLAREDVFSENQFCRIHLERESLGEGWVEKVQSRIQSEKCRKVVVYHFEYKLNSPSINQQKLRLMEWLVATGKIVVIMSTSEPEAYFFTKLADRPKKESKSQPDEFSDRWADVISRFKKVYAVENEGLQIRAAVSNLAARLKSDPKISEEERIRVQTLAESLLYECLPQAFLQNIGQQILRQSGFKKMNPVLLLDQVFAQAQLFYQRVWDNCSQAEQLTLLHLAEDRFLSPNDPHTKLLFRKGLIVRAPDIGLMNETFRRFVISRCVAGEGLEKVEKQARNASPWEALKVPLLVVFVGVVFFLLLTQKDFYGSSWTLVTGLTTGIPVVFKLLSLFQGEGTVQKVS